VEGRSGAPTGPPPLAGEGVPSIARIRHNIYIYVYLKNRKECGPDEIYNEHLKDTTPTLKGVWTTLFNENVKQEKIPAA
jgi:hypothetical protein